MKQIIIIAIIGLFVLSGCTGVKTLSTGLENEAYLEFVGNSGNYSDGVIVTIDDKTTFTVNVNKDHANRPKGKVYAISTGNHTISVSYKGTVIYDKQIFVSAQETKRILLQ